MASEQEFADYLSGQLPEAERAALEEKLFADQEGAAEIVSQRQLDLALSALLKAPEANVEASILASIRGLSEEASVKKVLAAAAQKPLVTEPVRPSSRTPVAQRAVKLKRGGVIKKDRPSWWQLFQAIGYTAAAVGIFAFSLFGIPWLRDWGKRPSMPGIAEVRDDANARWGARQRPLRWGDSLQKESLVLDSGVVELAFRNGATLVAEGPARLELADAGRVILHQGKVSAKVPPSAVGFTVETASGKVVDRGTQFGVKASPSGIVETHVFEGRVDVTPSDRFQKPMEALKRDMALRLDPQDSSVMQVSSDVRQFPRSGRVVAEPLHEGGFDHISAVGNQGMPDRAGIWGGDPAEIVAGKTFGITPHSGTHMLRFLEARDVPTDRPNTEVWTASEQWQFVDLTPYRDAVSNGVTAELSALFNRAKVASAGADEFTLVMAAYRGRPEDVKVLWWWNRPDMALAYSQDTIRTDNDPTTWERDEVRFEVPPGANFLLISIAASKSDPNAKLGGHFADSVALRLVVPPTGAVHAQR